MERQFDGLAPVWDTRRGPAAFDALEQALAAVSPAPTRVLDLGTGTGEAALRIARRFTGADVVGVDLSAAMLAEARRKTPDDLAARMRFEQADASKLRFEDGSFDLVSLANMIPFFDELDRLTAPAGSIVFSFSSGPSTPIYVPSARLREELARRGFTEFADFGTGRSTAFLATRQKAG